MNAMQYIERREYTDEEVAHNLQQKREFSVDWVGFRRLTRGMLDPNKPTNWAARPGRRNWEHLPPEATPHWVEKVATIVGLSVIAWSPLILFLYLHPRA